MIIKAMHGSNQKFKEFSLKAKRIPNDFFGGGIAYFTDDKKVALTYSKAMTARYGGEEHLYQVELSLDKIFDVDKVYTGADLQKFWAYIKPEAFARGAGLLKLGVDKYHLISKLQDGTVTVMGNDVFRGLSQGNVDSSGAEKILKKLGYDGLRYNGGDNMSAGRHNVYLPYNLQDIKITNVFKVNRKIIVEEVRIPSIGHLTFSRDLLPQINDQAEFMDHLSLMGITNEPMELGQPGDFKATQQDGFSLPKIKELIGTYGSGQGDLNPILVSSDDYILDGHHRWAALWNRGEPVPFYRLNAPILELIRIAADFTDTGAVDAIMSESFSPYESSLEEALGGSRQWDVLYHHFDARKGISFWREDNILAKWTHDIHMTHVNALKTKATGMGYGVTKNRVDGTSLTRNIHLTYNDHEKKWILELDRKKLRDNNKLHVIDADVVAGQYSPHLPKEKLSPTDTARGRNQEYWTKGGGMADDFAEEFLEGDLPNLHRYLRAIWIKGPLASPDIAFSRERIFYDMLAKYVIDYNIPVKYYPTGKDATEDLLEWAGDESDVESMSSKYAASKGQNLSDPFNDKLRMSRVVMNMRKSINITGTNKL